MKREWTKKEIKDLLERNDTMVCRSLVQLYNCQDEVEKTVGDTVSQNGVGFNCIDAPFMTSCAEFYLKNNYLSKKQIAFVRKKIMKYANQLTLLANNQ